MNTAISPQQNVSAQTESQSIDVATVAMNGVSNSEEKDNLASSGDTLDLPTSSADGLVKKPFKGPLESVTSISRPPLTADQQQDYERLLRIVSKWTTVPSSSAKAAVETPITDSERMFLTRECLLRYLRATSWNIPLAETRLRATLVWRREYGVERLTADFISVENETGKQLITGYDVNARPCLYMYPSRQNTPRTDRQIQHLVFMLERVIDVMVPGQETLALLINFAALKSGQGASLGQGKQTMYILQNHYPERLGRALVTNIPFMISGFFKLITPFIDPLTREKLKFNEDMALHVPPTQLLKENGGEVEFEYDHAVYWPALVQMADKMRSEYQTRWENGGKRIGEHEGYLRGAAEKSLAESEAPPSKSEDSSAGNFKPLGAEGATQHAIEVTA